MIKQSAIPRSDRKRSREPKVRRALNGAAGDDRQLVRLSTRLGFCVRFDDVLRAANGEFISVHDNSGKLLFTCAFSVVACAWLQRMARSGDIERQS